MKMISNLSGIGRWMIRHRRKFAVAAAGFLVSGIAILAVADRACQDATEGRMFRTTEEVPFRDVGLVLGTGKFTKSGRLNLHFTRRIEAAAALYHAGKVRHLLVSGDNHVSSYDEPTDMRNALIEAGVPPDAITRDYAGFRTLDSVIRAKRVFALTDCTIITEEFHCPRALWISTRHGIDAVAFAAPDPGLRCSLKVKAREYVARAWCGLDLYVLGREPKFGGPREPIVLSLK